MLASLSRQLAKLIPELGIKQQGFDSRITAPSKGKERDSRKQKEDLNHPLLRVVKGGKRVNKILS